MRGKIKSFSSFYILLPKLCHSYTKLSYYNIKQSNHSSTKVETTMQLKIILLETCVVQNLAKLREGGLYNVRDGRAGFNTYRL